MKRFLKEFRAFISRGNVVDMAVGVIIGTAFGKISTSLVNDVIMPFIGWLIGDIDLTALNITLRPAVMDGDTVVTEAVVIGIGTFIAVVIDFIIIAFIIFLLIKGMNKLARKKEAAAEKKANDATREELLLEEIRDILKERKENQL
jgi:large conductance mechanosensitive channel